MTLEEQITFIKTLDRGLKIYGEEYDRMYNFYNALRGYVNPDLPPKVAPKQIAEFVRATDWANKDYYWISAPMPIDVSTFQGCIDFRFYVENDELFVEVDVRDGDYHGNRTGKSLAVFIFKMIVSTGTLDLAILKTIGHRARERFEDEERRRVAERVTFHIEEIKKEIWVDTNPFPIVD